MHDLTVTLVQTSLHWGDRDKNLGHFDSILENLPPTDLVILPEMFSTGFIVEPANVAETMDGKTVGWLRSKAADKHCCITGSLIIKESGNYYNRLIWMPPGGDLQYYDKRHPFRMAGEHERFLYGSKKLIVTLQGWKICPLVCYDLRFPVWSKNRMIKNYHEYDLLIYVANWPEVRNHAWKSLLVARAIENQSYVAAVNRIGVDGNGFNHAGDSMVVDAKGIILSKILPGEDAVATITLSYKVLREFRLKFQVGLDWDEFDIRG
jgi:omega-amidase